MVLAVKSECNINALFKIKATVLFLIILMEGVEVAMPVDHVHDFLATTFIGRIV